MQNDFNKFLEVLHRGVDLNEPWKDGRLPLVLAAEQSNQFVHVALLTGAAVNDQEPNTGQTALHAAVSARKPEVCTRKSVPRVGREEAAQSSVCRRATQVWVLLSPDHTTMHKVVANCGTTCYIT